MSHVSAIVCECCGQPLRSKPAARKAASFKSYDDFVPAYNAARHAAIAELGNRWYLVPGASQWARIPAPWAACKVYGRISHAPRDRRLPAAQFWPAGVLPVGPEYAAPDAHATAPEFRARVRELAAKHRKVVADMRAYHDLLDCPPTVRSARYLAYLGEIRQQATVAARCARFAEAA